MKNAKQLDFFLTTLPLVDAHLDLGVWHCQPGEAYFAFTRRENQVLLVPMTVAVDNSIVHVLCIEFP